MAKIVSINVKSLNSDVKRLFLLAILIWHSCPLWVSESIVDPNGSYIILRTVYQGNPLILCSVYVDVPNVSQINFLSTLFLKLSQMPPSPIICGDFNIAFSEVTDKLPIPGNQLSPSLKNMSRAFQKCIRHFVLYNLWRIVHPMERTFSFFSPPHSSNSCIDFFFFFL